jgi:hypothetical protein
MKKLILTAAIVAIAFAAPVSTASALTKKSDIVLKGGDDKDKDKKKSKSCDKKDGAKCCAKKDGAAKCCAKKEGEASTTEAKSCHGKAQAETKTEEKKAE